MAEYIESKVALGMLADAAIEAQLYDDCEEETIRKCMSIVQRAPAADVAPVVHGRWERDELFAPYCTVCESSPMSALRPEGNYRYCPHCGALMDGGKNDAAD